MGKKHFTFNGMGLHLKTEVIKLPPDHDPSDMPCPGCGCEKPTWDYILDFTQLGYLADHVLTVVRCAVCDEEFTWEYYIEYATPSAILKSGALND